MKLVSFFDQRNLTQSSETRSNSPLSPRVGALSDDLSFVIPLPFSGIENLMTEFAIKDPKPPEDPELGFRFAALSALIAEVEAKGFGIPMANVKLLAPVPRPNSLRDAYAFRQHVETARKNRGLEMIPEFDLFPVFYFSNHLAITGPGAVAVEPLHLEQLDYELEIAAVIGKPGKNLNPKTADQHIFGFTIMNDWSARKMQMDEMKLNLGPAKGKDFATSLGPYLVTLDELKKSGHWQASPKGGVFHGKMLAKINGKTYSEGLAESMHWTFGEILARVSYGVRLETCDVMGSGTVGTGCLLELNGSKVTKDLWLKANDEVSLEVEGLGTLTNQIVNA